MHGSVTRGGSTLSSLSDPRRWLRFSRPGPATRVTLVCLPHAGGSATFFRRWSALLPPAVDLVAVQYPGRGDRLVEPCVEDIVALTRHVTEALERGVGGPLALFGHSLGASLAYEVACRLQERGRPPVHLVASGRPAPHRQHRGDRHLASDDELWREVVRLGGTDPELADDPDLRDLAIPVLRNDYRLAETYTVPVPTRLSCPVTAFLGDDDGEVGADQAAAWADTTDVRFDLERFPGGHFYLAAEADVVIGRIVARLVPARGPGPTDTS